MQLLKSYHISHRGENTRVEMRMQVWRWLLHGHSCNTLFLFPFPDQGSFFPSWHSKHPEKSARRQTEQPGAHHSIPPGTSLPHQGGHLCLSSGDPWLSKRGVTCQEAARKPYPDHHQHCQKTQPKHWGSSLLPIWRIINHRCHFSTVEMSCYCCLNNYHFGASEESSLAFLLFIYVKK